VIHARVLSERDRVKEVESYAIAVCESRSMMRRVEEELASQRTQRYETLM